MPIRAIEAKCDEHVGVFVEPREEDLIPPDARRRVAEGHIHLPLHPRAVRSELDGRLPRAETETARAAELGPGGLGKEGKRGKGDAEDEQSAQAEHDSIQRGVAAVRKQRWNE
jgi:hypothetical protein